MPGEVVTLQLGHYAGCVGAHWWGLQAAALRSPAEASELETAVLFRAGRTRGGQETHTPRLVALELKGGVGALSPGGAEPEAPVSWDGEVAAYLESASAGGSAPRDDRSRTGDAAAAGKGSASAPGPGTSPASSQLLSQAASSGSSVQLWSDYLSVPLHPKSIYVIRQYMHDGECGCLEGFGQGESLLQDPGCVEEVEDRLHFYVEECDYLQGFQVLCDLHNGFSGVGAKVTELLHDEYAAKGILTWGLTPVSRDVGDCQKNVQRLVNTALGIVHLSSHSSLFCPLSLWGSLGIKPEPPVTFPYISYEASLSYHSSAILAAALETLSAPYRLRRSHASLPHLADSLTFSGRKVVAAWAALPFPVLRGCSLADTLAASQQQVPWQPLSSCREQQGSCCFAQSVVLRGIGKGHLSSCPAQQPRSPLHAWQSSEQVLQHYLHTLFPGALSTSHLLEQPCSTLPPYPQFFSPLLSREGFLLDKPPGYSSAAVESIPVLAALQACPALHRLLCSLPRELGKLRLRRWLSSCAAAVEEEEELHEALESLRTLAQCYELGLGAAGAEEEEEADSD